MRNALIAAVVAAVVAGGGAWAAKPASDQARIAALEARVAQQSRFAGQLDARVNRAGDRIVRLEHYSEAIAMQQDGLLGRVQGDERDAHAFRCHFVVYEDHSIRFRDPDTDRDGITWRFCATHRFPVH